MIGSDVFSLLDKCAQERDKELIGRVRINARAAASRGLTTTSAALETSLEHLLTAFVLRYGYRP